MVAMMNKVALITGSTGGIGLGIAKQLASKGASIIVHGLSKSDDALQLCEDLRTQYKTTVNFVGADLASVSQIETMMKTVQEQFGGADIIVNNAGIQHVDSVEKFPVEMWDKVIQVNLSSVFHTTRLGLPLMRQKNWGRIVNIASVHGLVASLNKTAYVAAKHGLLGFTKATALETARTGVTVNAVCPGWVLTPLVAKQIEARAAAQNLSFEDAKQSLLLEKQPSGDFVTPEQLGDLVAFLCSDSASQIRGAAYTMDGAWTAQ